MGNLSAATDAKSIVRNIVLISPCASRFCEDGSASHENQLLAKSRFWASVTAIFGVPAAKRRTSAA